MGREAIFAGLNPEQRRAVESVRGPVCILAGAGSGKTTTITRRIANQVAAGAFPPSAILAVTFTEKAAGEMRRRLEALGVRGAAARTFHSAALAQLRYFRPDESPRIVASKALPLRNLAGFLPRAYRFRPAGDLATEVEWAQNQRLRPDTYLDALGDHSPPIPADLMQRLFARYERWKREEGGVDFEDLLEGAIRLLEVDEHALATVRERYRAFTVDEYQDVNLLQQTLLDLWLGMRDDVCAVGDDYQAIYGFTGASPRYLLALPERFTEATVVRLEANYRSTPEVLALANRLVPRLGGAEKTLRATRASGPEPVVRAFAGAVAETDFVVERAGALAEDGIPLEELAVLVRTNARTADFEEAFHEAGIPFQGASLLARDAARQLFKRLRRIDGPLAATVSRVAREQGLLHVVPDGLGERELTRQNDLARLVRLARELDDGALTIGAWLTELERRFGPNSGRGVHLLTLHRAKGLEFDAVFVPRVEEKELPSRLARTPEEIAEERRLLYVGMTRARLHLAVTWSGKPSRFLVELGLATATRPRKPEAGDAPPGFDVLKEWRRRRAQTDGIPAYVVFHDATLAEIARRRPRDASELAAVAGVGPTKLERYGADVLSALAEDCAPRIEEAVRHN
ncbi:MAG: ATP-dependent DNA helicase UvrD2 [Thermoleophilia bacterium]|nr:ATP-dependent DNA helicase UvrD2 [Thermoleophilia bacterium]